MARILRGRYYWPTRIKDTMRYLRECDACQRFGPLKPTVGLKPILNLQPMDMLGMDFLGPIKLTGISGGSVRGGRVSEGSTGGGN